MRTYEPDISAYDQGTPRHAGKKGVLLMRTRTVRAGNHLDADIYPVLDGREAKKRGRTPEQMKKANFDHAFRRLTQICNANFGDGDLKCDLTMAGECSFQEFEKIKRRFMDRLRRRFRAAGRKLEYLGIIESTHGGKQHHMHMLIRGGVIGRDEIEKLWGQGIANADRVQTQYEGKGLEGFCRYITKSKEGQEKLMARKWFSSKGLRQPKTTYSDRKFSRGAAARIEKAVQEDARREFEKRYPGYRLEEYSVHYSDFLPGVYIHAHMRKIQ